MLNDSIIVLTWTWKKCQRSKILGLEMKSGCGMNTVGGESNGNVYGRYGLSSRGNNELWSGGDGEVLHPEMVWTFGKNGCERLDKKDIQE